MQLVFFILVLVFGLIVIIKSGDLLIDSALGISNATALSKQFIGLTLLSLATTAPELCVSCFSAFQGRAQMCVNNGLGSIICNIGLVLAISLIALKQNVKREEFNFKGITIIFVFMLLYCFSLNNNISKIEGLCLIILYVLFIFFSIRLNKNSNYKSNNYKIKKKELIYNLFLFLLGAVGIGLSARLLVNSCIKIASILKISEGLIAITVLALGTALPELIATITSIRKKTLDLALGNIVGANIMNGTVLIGLSSIFSPTSLSVSMQSKFITIPLCIIFNIILVLPILIKQKTFKFQGILMLFLFIVYYILIFLF